MRSKAQRINVTIDSEDLEIIYILAEKQKLSLSGIRLLA